ncbi:MAG: hypothetical protein K2H30_04490 [Clostridia bacterium]|nr:hypothetical protein [Clostridia bacterium]
MRVYFLSCTPAVLKLNGLYVGRIDSFERHIELDPADRVLAEIVPGENLQSVNFFLDGEFFDCPPDFADVYLLENDALVYIREYGHKDVKLQAVFQTRFCGNLITVFSQGGVYLSSEGAEYSLTPLPVQFLNCRAEQHILAGRDVLALYGGNKLVIISEHGKVIFQNTVEAAEFGDTLFVRAPFETCTAAKAECYFSYDGDRLTQTGGRTVETRPPEPNATHFAFFESVLTCGDFVKYLDDGLKPKAGDLKSYLGNFVSVTVPTEKFYALHPNLTAAGLVYPLKSNLYEVKYFAVEMQNGEITNISPVE